MSTMIPKKVDTVNRKGKTEPAPEASVLDLIHTVMHGVRSLQYQWPDEPALDADEDHADAGEHRGGRQGFHLHFLPQPIVESR